MPAFESSYNFMTKWNSKTMLYKQEMKIHINYEMLSKFESYSYEENEICKILMCIENVFFLI